VSETTPAATTLGAGAHTVCTTLLAIGDSCKNNDQCCSNNCPGGKSRKCAA
jgi:hypothetical protein